MQFQDTFFMKVTAEFLGTALLVILGNGAVANVHLKDKRGGKGVWDFPEPGAGTVDFGAILRQLEAAVDQYINHEDEPR